MEPGVVVEFAQEPRVLGVQGGFARGSGRGSGRRRHRLKLELGLGRGLAGVEEEVPVIEELSLGQRLRDPTGVANGFVAF